MGKTKVTALTLIAIAAAIMPGAASAQTSTPAPVVVPFAGDPLCIRFLNATGVEAMPLDGFAATEAVKAGTLTIEFLDEVQCAEAMSVAGDNTGIGEDEPPVLDLTTERSDRWMDFLDFLSDQSGQPDWDYEFDIESESYGLREWARDLNRWATDTLDWLADNKPAKCYKSLWTTQKRGMEFYRNAGKNLSTSVSQYLNGNYGPALRTLKKVGPQMEKGNAQIGKANRMDWEAISERCMADDEKASSSI